MYSSSTVCMDMLADFGSQHCQDSSRLNEHTHLYMATQLAGVFWEIQTPQNLEKGCLTEEIYLEDLIYSDYGIPREIKTCLMMDESKFGLNTLT